MGLVRTMGKFCYVECDERNCNKKYEHIDERILQELSILCGWENRGNRWICPTCAEKLGRVRKAKDLRESKRRTRGSSTFSE